MNKFIVMGRIASISARYTLRLPRRLPILNKVRKVVVKLMNTANKISERDETRSKEIARIVSQLPEKEQEKIFYMIKGVELAGAGKVNIKEDRAAV